MIGQRIRARRLFLGMTQEWLGQRLTEEIARARPGSGKILKSHVSQWENGVVKPSHEMHEPLARVLECTVSYLFGETEDPTSAIGSSGLSDEEKEIVEAVRRLTPDERKVIHSLIARRKG